MNDFDYSHLQARAVQIRDEARLFVDRCKVHVQKARALHDDVVRLRDEAMILREECIAERGKSLAILNLTRKLVNFPEVQRSFTSSFDEDSETVIRMIAEIKRVSIADGNPLQDLRSQLLNLSYLPVSE